MKIDANDPRLTAYALDELSDAERAEIEVLLAGNEAARQEVEAIRRVAGNLSADLQDEPCPALAPEQLAEIKAQLPAVEDTGTSAWRWLWLTGGALAVSVIVASLFLPALSSTRERARRVQLVKPAPQPEFKEVAPTVNAGTIAFSGGALSVNSRTPTSAEPAPTAPSSDAYMNRSYAFNNGDLVNRGPLSAVRQDAGGNVVVGDSAVKFKQAASGLGTGRASDQLRKLEFSKAPMLADSSQIRIVRGSQDTAADITLGETKYYSPDAPSTGSSDESYARTVESSFAETGDHPVSTFSLDVDTASYANIRRFLTQGQLPPRDAVRIEEMLNYFTYDYEAPTGNEPFALHVEAAQCPWNPAHRLALVGLRAKDVAPRKASPMNLVFLIDVSGSMQPDNKLPLIKRALRLLVQQLTARDRVAIVVYAGESRVALTSTRGDDREAILDAIESLRADGSTNGGAGIQSAYDQASANFIDGGVNRVILCTDGDFNVGLTDQSELVQLIQRKAKSGVFLSVLGFGMGNLKDATMEKLADKGNGNYNYIDDLEEARKVLVDQIRSTLVTVAKDVKVQIEFNAALVKSYRLVGYDNRLLAARDFNNDRKDAGDIGAGHTVTALYEIVPTGERAGRGDDLMTVKLRYKEPDATTSKLLTANVKDSDVRWGRASNDFRFAAAVAEFGMLLRESSYRGQASFDDVLALAQGALGRDANGYRAEFADLVRRAKALARPDVNADP